MKALRMILPVILSAILLLPCALAVETVVLPEGEQAVSAFIADEEQRTRPAAALAGPDDIFVTARAAALIDKATGTLIYAKNEDEMLPPASVTKIMTMLLTVEAIENGTLSLDTVVTCSEYASSMGGSQIYLAPGEKMTVNELLKSVAVGSANDASVALAEHISGSEEQFARRMNARAGELGMEHTEFHNCTGLPSEPGNRISAHDIAIMSRELLSHELIYDYTTIWMDSVRGGTFGLANTNKLIYYYEGATGLKTGFTQEAKFCVSASARRGESEFIAVVLGDESSDARWKSARAMLDFAFANYINVSVQVPELPEIRTKLGREDFLSCAVQGSPVLLIPKSKASSVETETVLPEFAAAPVSRGDRIGRLIVRVDGEVLAETPICAAVSVERMNILDIFVKFLRILCA